MRTARPILFSGPMVRALLAGTKTQTRRIVKPQPNSMKDFGRLIPYRLAEPPPEMPSATLETPINCPYGYPGDLLVVRETFRLAAEFDDRKPTLARPNSPVHYEADGRADEGWGRTRVSIHMPRWASRLTLEITEVRVERLQDISEADAQAEGIERIFPEGSASDTGPNHFSIEMLLHGLWGHHNAPKATDLYRWVWEMINGDDSWTANPWVWAVSFTVHHQNVDAFLARAA